MAKATLDIEITQDEEVTIVVLDGPVDSATMDQFKKALDPLFRGSAPKVLLDCHQLTYMNSKAIGMLARYRRECYVSGGRMAICNLNEKLVRTMDLLGLGSMLKKYDGRDEAIAALR